MKEKNNFIDEKDEYIKQLNDQIISLESSQISKEGKLESKIKKLEKLNEENNKKLNLDKAQFHKFYQYDTEYWALISIETNEQNAYQWVNLKDVKINLSSNSLTK